MAKRKGWRGRSRNRKALPRTPSGQLSRSGERRSMERSTQELEQSQSMGELIAIRARVLGLSEPQAADQKSETIAGRMALRGQISAVQAMAIEHYAKAVRAAARAMLAPRGPRCSLTPSLGGGDGWEDPVRYADTMRRYNDAFGALRDAGERANRAINMIIRDFCELPASEIEHVRLGADALVKHFGFDRAKAA